MTITSRIVDRAFEFGFGRRYSTGRSRVARFDDGSDHAVLYRAFTPHEVEDWKENEALRRSARDAVAVLDEAFGDSSYSLRINVDTGGTDYVVAVAAPLDNRRYVAVTDLAARPVVSVEAGEETWRSELVDALFRL